MSMHAHGHAQVECNRGVKPILVSVRHQGRTTTTPRAIKMSVYFTLTGMIYQGRNVKSFA